jgi:imidazolonepropionase-like amidohydrolase
MQALISATSLSAESLNLAKEIGSIAPGMQADIVGFDGDPLKDVNAAGRAVFVMRGGKVYENVARGRRPAGRRPRNRDSCGRAAGWLA